VTARDIPNLITVLRIVFVVPFTLLLLEGRYMAALLVFAGLGASDALDGYLARRYQWGSRLGALLDPLADKILLVSAYLALGWSGMLPIWLVALVIGRDAVIVSGAGMYRLVVGSIEMEPTILSKVNTFFQIVLVLEVVFSAAVVTLPDALRDGTVVMVAATTLVSGANYVWAWSRKAWQHRRGEEA